MGRKVKRFIGSLPITPHITENQELIIPANAMLGWIKGLVKHLYGPECMSLKDEEIYFASIQALTDSRFKELSHEVQQIKAEKVFQSVLPLFKQRHPFPIVRVHADIISNFLKTFPFKARSEANQSLWVKEHLPNIYAKLNKTPRCKVECPCGATEIQDVYSLLSNKPAVMRNRILAHYHGTTELNIEQLLAGR